MSFAKPRKVEKNYDLISACSWYVPGISGLFAVLAWFIVGMVLASIVVMPLMATGAMDLPHSMLIMYPLQFLPVFIYVRLQSSKNSTFDRGYKLDSNNFGARGGIFLAVIAALATAGAAIVLELVNSILPDVSEVLKNTMEALLGGPLWISLLCTAVMAPICEEWMCRGVILRGLLNYQRKTTDIGSPEGRGMKPALAIMISALFFAAIHGNIWQGITAFAIGCLLGYVYYKTGSLKLTILMHTVNNATSVLLAHFGGEEVMDAKSLLDIIPAWEYGILFVIGLALVCFLVTEVSKIELKQPQGNCDVIPNADDEYNQWKESTKTLTSEQ